MHFKMKIHYSCCIGVGVVLLLGAPGVVLGEDSPAAAPMPVMAPPKTSGSASASGVELPASVPLDRYQLMLDKPLFALATQAAPPPPPPVETAAFSKDLVLTGVARLASGEFVSIVSRDQTQRFGLMTGDSYNGITVASVAWSDAVGKTKVTLKQGSEFGVIGFDEANLASGGGDQPPGGGPPNGQPPIPPGVTMPAANTGRPPGAIVTPRAVPARRRSIPAPPPQ